jgi:hypothetical protein
MRRTVWIASVVFLIAIASALIYVFHSQPIVDSRHDADIFGGPTTVFTFDPKNATYTIDGQLVTLINGVAEIESAPGSASKTTTRYFGNEAYGDIDGDNDNDVAYLITQDGGGTGLFYYAVVALRTPTGYKVTNVVLLGDRIAPQTTEIDESAKVLRINFADRKPDEPMSAEPSVAKTMTLKINADGELEVVKK